MPYITIKKTTAKNVNAQTVNPKCFQKKKKNPKLGNRNEISGRKVVKSIHVLFGTLKNLKKKKNQKIRNPKKRITFFDKYAWFIRTRIQEEVSAK